MLLRRLVFYLPLIVIGSVRSGAMLWAPLGFAKGRTFLIFNFIIQEFRRKIKFSLMKKNGVGVVKGEAVKLKNLVR